MDYLNIILRGLISMSVLFLVTKLIGKKQVSELNLFDYVVGLSIGNFSAEITINQDVPLTYGLLAIALYGFVAFIISYLSLKSIHLRRFIFGTPTLIIEKGKLLEKNLKKANIDINDMLEFSRNSGYFDLSEIEYAILEANGKMSFLPKAINKPVTLKDMNIKKSNDGLVANVVIDGKIMKNNLKNMHKTEKWLKQELKVQGYSTLDDILLATLDINEKVIIYNKNSEKKGTNVLE